MFCPVWVCLSLCVCVCDQEELKHFETKVEKHSHYQVTNQLLINQFFSLIDLHTIPHNDITIPHNDITMPHNDKAKKTKI